MDRQTWDLVIRLNKFLLINKGTACPTLIKFAEDELAKIKERVTGGLNG